MSKDEALRRLESLGITLDELELEAENIGIEITDENLEKIANFIADNAEYYEARHRVMIEALQNI
jgi:chaperonin GroEL (HSP60 family)